MDEKTKNELVIKIAHAHADSRMTGPDGPVYIFCAPDYPDAAGATGETELEAAWQFLKDLYE